MFATILPREIRYRENDMGKATVQILCMFFPDRIFLDEHRFDQPIQEDFD